MNPQSKRIALNGKVDLVMQDLGRHNSPPWLMWYENKYKQKSKVIGISEYSMWYIVYLIKTDKFKAFKQRRTLSMLRIP